LAYTSNILLTSKKLWNWGGIAPLTPKATRLFWLRATDQRRNSWLNEVYLHADSVILINQHHLTIIIVQFIYEICILCLLIMFIFLIYSQFFFAGKTFPTIM